MGEFRRSIIKLAEAVQVLGMIVATLAGGLFGAGLGFIGRDPGFAFLGFVVGAGVAFIVAATGAAVLFTLSETADNTARLVTLLERDALRNDDNSDSTLETPAIVEPMQAQASAKQERGHVTDFSNAETWRISRDELVTPASVHIIRRAVAAGWEVEYWPDSNIMFVRGKAAISCERNRNIERFSLRLS